MGSYTKSMIKLPLFIASSNLNGGKMVLVGISKAWNNRGNHKHPRAKKYIFGYYYDSNGKFYSKRLSKTQALLERRKIVKVKWFYCEHCGSKFMSDKCKEDPQCPNCNK